MPSRRGLIVELTPEISMSREALPKQPWPIFLIGKRPQSQIKESSPITVDLAGTTIRRIDNACSPFELK